MLDLSMTAAVDFEVEVRPIYDAAGNAVPERLGRGVYRKDTDDLLSVCGHHFQPTQHMDLIRPVLDKFDAQGYDIQLRKASSRALYDLKGKKGAFCNISTTDNGAVMVAEIITGDFIEPTGSSGYLQSGPDTMLRRHRIINSHNSKFATSEISDYNRLICMNGIVRPDFSVSAYGKHTKGFSVEGFLKKVQNNVEMMQGDADRFGLYAKTPLSIDAAMDFLKSTIAKLKNKSTGEANWSQPMLEKIMDFYSLEEPTVWGLYQALTYWSTHDPMKGNSDAVTGRLNRDARVAATVRSKQFADLVPA